MAKVDLGGLAVDAITQVQFLEQLAERLSRNEKTFVTTPYSEFLYAALRDREVLTMLNRADIAIPDGVGILWAERFLSLPFTVNGYYSRIIQALVQMVYSGVGVLLYPKSIYRTFPEKITGADVVWDIAELAAKRGDSVYLLGGFGDTPKIAAQRLQQRYPNLRIAGASNKHPDDASVIADLQQAQPDILLVAYGPIRQERWIVDHYDQLPAKLMIGLGGTFDYIAGKKINPPRFIRASGLEWLYRLVTQPKRFKRIMQATFGLITALVRYKVFESLPYRPNVVCVVFNKDKEVLICQRNPADPGLRLIGQKNTQKYKNYWQLPQGGIAAGEPLMDAAKRELHEETGVISVTLLSVSDKINRYSYSNARRPLLFNDTPYKGQEQRVIYFLFQGMNSEIRPDNEELIAFRWIQPGGLIDSVHPEKHDLVTIVLDDLEAGRIEFSSQN